MTRYCWQCAQEISDSSVYCDKCGAPLQAKLRPTADTQRVPLQAPSDNFQSREQTSPPGPASRARTRIGVGRWLVIVASSIVLLSWLLPVVDDYGAQKMWVVNFLSIYWFWLAVPTLAAILISVYALKRAQLAACACLLLTVAMVVRMMFLFQDPDDMDVALKYQAGLWVAAVFAFVGAVCALVNGITAQRD